MQDLSAGASKVWGALPSMRFGSSASKMAKAAQAEGKAAQASEGSHLLPAAGSACIQWIL